MEVLLAKGYVAFGERERREERFTSTLVGPVSRCLPWRDCGCCPGMSGWERESIIWGVPNGITRASEARPELSLGRFGRRGPSCGEREEVCPHHTRAEEVRQG